MKEELVLEYKRVDVDRCTGRIVFKVDDKGSLPSLTFESVTFDWMLRQFGARLKSSPNVKAIWQRIDRPGLLPYALDEQVTALFRSDIDAAIASMSPAERSPSAAVRRVRQERVAPPGIRAGFDTLADSFGEIVYTRARVNEVECPVCGMWTYRQKMDVFCCLKGCSGRIELSLTFTNRWAGVRVADLLKTSAPRFYLPRMWNEDPPWVSASALQAKLDEYKKEKTQ